MCVRLSLSNLFYLRGFYVQHHGCVFSRILFVSLIYLDLLMFINTLFCTCTLNSYLLGMANKQYNAIQSES